MMRQVGQAEDVGLYREAGSKGPSSSPTFPTSQCSP